jgi:hypothetical protein
LAFAVEPPLIPILVYRNPGIPTLEGAVFQSLVKAGAISPDNADDHQKVRPALDTSELCG